MVRFASNQVNRIVLFLATVLLLQHPSSHSISPNRTTIEVGTLSAEDGDGWILSSIRGFEAKHPDIGIRHFAIGAPSRDDIQIEDLPELALNVIGVRSDLGNEVGYLVDNDLIVPLEEFLPDPDFEFEDFFPGVWDYVTYEGHRWGIPFLCSSVALIADWDVFQKSGVTEVPKTWEDLFLTIPKLTRDTDLDGALDQWGFRLGMRGRHDTHMYYLWMTKVLQDGGRVMKDGRFDLSHPVLREAYETVKRLQESPSSREDNRRFKVSAGDLSARYGLQIAPSYFLNPLMKQHNYRVVPWFTSGEEVILDERRHYLCIARSTPEKEKASWEFLKWVIREGAEHPDGAWTFHLSARKDLMERADVLQKTRSWAKGFDVLHKTKGWNKHFGDQVPGRFEAVTRLEEIVTQLFHGTLSFDEAMRQGEQECNAILTRSENERSRLEDLHPDQRGWLREADTQWRLRAFEKAAVSYLELIADIPEVLTDPGLRSRFLSSLKNCGFFLEAESFMTSRRPEILARIFLRRYNQSEGRMRSVLEEDAEVDLMIEAARIACASAHHGENSLEELTRFLEFCGSIRSSSGGHHDEMAELAVYHRGALDLVLRVRTRGESERRLQGDYILESIPVRAFAQKVAEDSIELASLAAKLSPDSIPIVFDALETRVEIGRRMNDLKGIVQSYHRVTGAFTEGDEAARCLLELAILLREEVRDLNGALAACDELRRRHPGSTVASKARMKGAIWLFEAKRYEEAKRVFNEISQESTGDSEKAGVLRALCDYGLGKKDDAEESIREYMLSHPDDELSARARAWLVSNRIADFRFLEAVRMIRSSTDEVIASPIERHLQRKPF